MFTPQFTGGGGPVLPERTRPASALDQIEALAAKLIIPNAALFVQHFLEHLNQCRHRVAELAARLEDTDRRMNAAVIRLLMLDPDRPDTDGASSGSGPEKHT